MKHMYVDMYTLNLFIEHSGEHWEQNIFCSYTTSILAKLSTWCFEHSGNINCSLLINLSHTDESWARWNMCMWICMLWIYSLSILENTDENKIFFVRSSQAFWLSSAPRVLSALVTSVVLYSLTWATMMSPGQDKTCVCGYIYKILKVLKTTEIFVKN